MEYKEKLIREYNELKKNIESLNKIILKWECFNLRHNMNKQVDEQDKYIYKEIFKLKQVELEKELGFPLNYPFELLESQLESMKKYLHILELRIEFINIESKGNKNILLS